MVTGRLLAEAPLVGDSIVLELSKPSGLPLSYEYRDASGTTLYAKSYSNFGTIAGSYLRPLRIETRVFHPSTGVLSSIWTLDVSAGAYTSSPTTALRMPQPASGERLVDAGDQ